MRRFSVLVSIAVVVYAGLLVVGRGSIDTLAQEGTPPAGGFEIAPGVTAEGPFAFVEGADSPSLYRLRFAPGTIYAFAPSPTLDLVYVESGTFSLRLDAPTTVTHLAETDGAGENVAAGTEFTVAPGGYLVLRPFVTGELRNEGQEDAVVTVAGILPDGMATPAAGTPAP